MALSEAKKAADKRYTDKLDNIMIRPYREEGAAIRAAAAAAGMSVQAYVLRAIRAWMEREQAGSIPADASSAVSREGTEAGGMPAPGDGFGISASSAGQSALSEDKGPAGSGRLPRTLEDGDSGSRPDGDEAAGDWRARLSRSPNRARTIKVIKRITEMPESGGKSNK